MKYPTERTIEGPVIDVGAETKHFRVIANGQLLKEISPNIGNARRLAANAIIGGGTAIIFESIEAWRDVGATLSEIKQKAWK
jgi:hypothetical protein